MTVDVHAHAVIPRYHQLLAGFGVAVPGYGRGPAVFSGDDAASDANDAVRRRIALMDEAGVSRQLLSAMYAPYLADEGQSVEASYCVNDAHAGMVRKHPDRFAAYGALPLPHVEAALAQLKYCLDELGMIGIALQCACLGESVVADRFGPLYAELDRRAAVVFFHPCINGLCSPLLTGWSLAPTVGAVFEDTTVALHLIIRQIPNRFPNITFIIPHLGGALPMLLNRLDNQLQFSQPGLPEAPSVTARRFYYDTVAHGSQAALRCAVEAFGHDHLVLGSDYPVMLPFENYCDTIGHVRGVGLPEAALRCILSTNAADMFPNSASKETMCVSDDSPTGMTPGSGE